MSDPKLVIKKETWSKFSTDEKLDIIYDTTISTRDSNIELAKKVDIFINKPPSCHIEARVIKLEKSKYLKNAISFLGGVVGGFGGSHIPK